MMKLGIIGAMELEVETLLGIMVNKTARSVAGSDFYEGSISGTNCVVVRCGIGTVNAALCVQILVSTFGVTHIVNTGIAGSLCARLDIGDFVISQDAMYHDFDCCVFGYPAGKVPGMPEQFTADVALRQLAFAAAEEVNPGRNSIGRIASGDQFICSQDQKDKIIAITGALCTEMEGAGIAHAAYRNNIPFVIIRAISDKADNSADMDYPTFEKLAAHRCAEVTRRLAAKLA